MSDQDDLTEVVHDTSSHRKLFSYLTADAADDYIAIMRLFTGTLLTDLSGSEVAAQLRDRSLDIDADVAEDRCKQLVLWGNLVRSVRETRVPTVAAYHRSRSRFHVSKLGGRLHREAEEILHAVDGVQEVARELLARIADSLGQILQLAADVHRPIDAEALAGAVTGVFTDHRVFTESVTDFYAYLAGVLIRYDLASEEYAQFKDLLLDYVDLIGADVNRNAPEIRRRLLLLLELLDPVLENLPAAPVLENDLVSVERLPGRTRKEWEQLAVWYGAGGRAVRAGPVAGCCSPSARPAHHQRPADPDGLRDGAVATGRSAQAGVLVPRRRQRHRASALRRGVRQLPGAAPAHRSGGGRSVGRAWDVVVGLLTGRRPGLVA